jgi:hypothetical protein
MFQSRQTGQAALWLLMIGRNRLRELDHERVFYVGAGDRFDDDRRVVLDAPITSLRDAMPRAGNQ